MSLKFITKIVLLWRIILTLIAAIAISLIPFKPSFPYSESILEPLGPKLLHAWANFDGVHYLTIINSGYKGTAAIQAFFPLYPFLIKYLTPAFGNVIFTGVVFSTICLILALNFLYKLILLDESSLTAKKTISLILLAPTAFYFSSFYTESLFLLLVVLCFYNARKHNFLLAGIVGGLAACTRIVGIFLIPALLVEWWEQYHKQKVSKPVQKLIYCFLPLTGLVGYMYYLKRVFNDPLLFLHVQPQFGVQREVDRLILLYQVFWRYVKMIWTVSKDSLLYYNVSLELISALMFLTLTISAFYRSRKSYAVFAFLSFIAPTLTGTFTSLPRYVLVLFPAFIVVAKVVKKPVWFTLLLISSAILLVVNTAMFIQGYWVA